MKILIQYLQIAAILSGDQGVKEMGNFDTQQ